MSHGIIHRYSFLLLLAIISSICLAIPQTGRAQLEEHQVKTAILYNFAKFVTWPDESFADKGSPLVIAILGNDALHKRIGRLEGKKVGDRVITIRHWSYREFKRRKKNCQILYVATSEQQKLELILAAVATEPILTVSDLPDFAQKGGVLKFDKSRKNIRFAINLDASNQAGLKISSKLFPLATNVIKNGQLR